jgi:YcxB-like protein
MTEYRATFTLDRSDYARSSRSIFHRRRDTRAFYLFMLLGAVVVVGATLFARNGPNYLKMALYLGLLAAVAAGVWASPCLSVRQNLKNHKLAFKPQTWTFSPSGVQVEAEGARSSFDWAVVTRLVEDPSYLHLYVSEGMAYAIPKRALSPQELEGLKSAFRQWLGPRAEVA